MTYRCVDPRFWTDAKVRCLSDDGKLLFLYLLTHPNLTALGAMRATVADLAAELKWSTRRCQAAMKEAVHQGLVEQNESAAYVSLPNFLRYNAPNSPNAVSKAWPRALELIPECPERRRLLTRMQAYLDSKSKEFREAAGDAIRDAIRDAMADGMSDAVPDGVSHGLATPCDIQDQDQDQDPPNPPKGAESDPPQTQTARTETTTARTEAAKATLELLNALTGAHFKPTPANLKHARARLGEGYTPADLETVVRGQVTRWRGTEWDKYLRPQTLFAEKFGGYLETAQRTNGHPGLRVNAAWEGRTSGEVHL